MPYFLNTPKISKAMLEAIGVDSLDELFDDGARRSCGWAGRWPCRRP